MFADEGRSRTRRRRRGVGEAAGGRVGRAGLPAHGPHVAAAAQRHALRRGGHGRDPGADGRGRGVRRGHRGGGGAGRVLAPRRPHAARGRVREARRGRRPTTCTPLLLPDPARHVRRGLPALVLRTREFVNGRPVYYVLVV